MLNVDNKILKVIFIYKNFDISYSFLNFEQDTDRKKSV